jgi:hypothetical protein
MRGHIVVPPLRSRAGWRGRQALSGCKAFLLSQVLAFLLSQVLALSKRGLDALRMLLSGFFPLPQAKKAAVKLGDFTALTLPTEGGVFHRKVTNGRPHAAGPSLSYDRRTTRPSNHRQFESINTSKSFQSRICGRLAGCGGRWFLPRTHH